jgi:hypothetical protein
MLEGLLVFFAIVLSMVRMRVCIKVCQVGGDARLVV